MQPDKAEPRNKGGRPAIVIDVEELEKLAGLQCTYDDAASWFGCSRETIKRRMREAEFREAWDRGRAKGKVSLRRSQFKLAETNASMAIFLGKLYLGQRDVTTKKLSGANGGSVQISEGKRELLNDIAERNRAGEAARETE